MRSRSLAVLVGALIAACTAAAPAGDVGRTGGRGEGEDDAGLRKDGADGVVDRTTPEGGGGTKATPTFVSAELVCKLVNGTGNDDPTANQTHFTANLRATDLGIPVDHQGTLYFFFGDTVGFKAIWSFGESQPDAVGYASVTAAEVAAKPSSLCTSLAFLTLAPGDSLGPGQDPRIAADFAGVYMRPPLGHTIGEYIKNPAGHGAFPNIPGDFEVPSGAFSFGGDVYVFYTTVTGPSAPTMKASYLAKWTAPTTSAIPVLDILYLVDQRFDVGGALRGDFVNVAALVQGEHVYLYGTGDYRRSAVHLARKPLAKLGQEGGFERWDPDTRSWKDPLAEVKPVVSESGNGELSVRWFPTIGRYMMLNQQELAGKNRVVARFAAAPEGPWSDAITVADMADPAFRAKHCCATASSCPGTQLFHCDRAGFYGTYLLPEVVTKPDGAFVASFLMSTWDPYNVVLMQATFE